MINNFVDYERDMAMPKMRGDWLKQAIRDNGYKVGYEIGVSNGQTFDKVLSFCKDVEWHGVDPWVTCPEYDVRPNGKGKWNHDANYAQVMKYVEKYSPRAFAHRMGSLEAAAEVEDESIDIVFIDGLHTYEGVKADIEAWEPKVRSGGLISGHDYMGHVRHAGVQKAVDERFGAENISRGPDLVWYIYKP